MLFRSQFQFYTAPSGTAGNAISFTQAMTLDASGRLVIGGTSAASGYNLTLRGAGLYVNEDSADTHAISLRSYWAGVAPAVQVVTNDPLLFVINGSERARIDSSGNLLVGTTSTLGKLRVQSADNSYVALIEDTNASYTSECLTVRPSRNTTNGSFYAYSYYNNGAAAYKFYVIDSGAIYSTSTSITSISDVSHKENVRDLNTGLAEVLALQPRRFDWKSGKGTDRKNAAGFIAQEVEIVLPELIEEWKENRDSDESLKAIRMGDMIPTLVKAIQELHAEIAALKAQLNP